MNYGVPLPLLWLCALGVLIYFPEHDAFVQVICLAFVIVYPLWRGIKFISDRELLSQFVMPDEKPLNVDNHEERRERFKAAFEARQRQYEKTAHSRTDERARQKAANPEAAASAEARSMKLSVLAFSKLSFFIDKRCINILRGFKAGWAFVEKCHHQLGVGCMCIRVEYRRFWNII